MNISPFEEFVLRPAEPYISAVTFALWTFTTPFYIFLIVVIINGIENNNLDLNTPFFRIVISAGIIDIITLINNYIGSVIPKWGFFMGFYEFCGRPLATFYLYFAWTTGICQAMSVSVLATNRLSAMMFPELYGKMWRRRRLYIAYSLQLLPGMLTSLPVLVNHCEWERTEQGLVAKILTPGATTVYFTIGGLFLGGNSFYLMCAYGYLYRILQKRNRNQLKLSNHKREMDLNRLKNQVKRREYRLFLMSSSIVAVQLTILLFFSTKLFPWSRLTTQGFYVFYNALSDLYSGISPYLLWIFSDSLRSHAYRVLGIKTNTENAIMVSVVSMNGNERPT